MSCLDPLRDDALEDYLLGRLPSAERDAVEEHLFACEECAERVEALQALRHALATGEAKPRQRPWALGLAAVIAVGIGVGLLREPAPVATPGSPAATPEAVAPDLAALGRFDPPSWEPRRLRSGGEAERRFGAGMQAYAEGRWLEAAAALDEAARLDPGAPGPAFFGGVCRLLAGDPDAGARALSRVVDLGETAYLEDALLYLARARLLQRDGPAARALLERVEDLGGERASEARELRRQLAAATDG